MNVTQRLYNCKDEELIPISRFTLFSLKRDLPDFTAFSSQFSEDYVKETEAKINLVENLLEPQAEVLALKQITERINTTLGSLASQMNQLTGYLTIAKNDLGFTTGSFGISALRKSINTPEIEGVINHLKLVIVNTENHQKALTAKGLPNDFVTRLKDTQQSLVDDREKQFEIVSKRKAIVHDNLSKMNELFERLSDIYAIGKVLYKNLDPVKLSEYTFTDLVKKVKKERSVSPTEPQTTNT